MTEQIQNQDQWSSGMADMGIHLRLWEPASVALKVDLETEVCEINFTPDDEIQQCRYAVSSGLCKENGRQTVLTDFAPVIGQGIWAFSVPIEKSLATFLNGMDREAEILAALISLSGSYSICQKYAMRDDHTIVVCFDRMKAAEYLVRFRKVPCCIHCDQFESTNDSPMMVGRPLTANEVNRSLQQSYIRFAAVGVRYCWGFLTKEEAIQNMRDLLYNNFHKFLSDSDVRLSIEPASWERYLEDYKKWKSGDQPNSKRGTPWLRMRAESEVKEASIEQKSLFYRLMNGFGIPLDYCEPTPSGMVKPEIIYTGLLAAKYPIMIPFQCTEDDGLLSDENPRGKTFSLQSNQGWKAVLKITALAGDANSQIWNNGEQYDYSSEGYVEGYTSEKARIYFNLHEGKAITDLIIPMQSRDWNAYYSFPLWQEYFEWSRKKADRSKRAEIAFFESFMSELPRPL